MIIKVKVAKKIFLGAACSLWFLFFVSCGRSAEKSVISAALSHPEIDWEIRKTENFVLYAPEDSYAAARLSTLSKQAETARQQVMERLQVVKQEKPPVLIFLESREQMEEFAGLSAEGKTVVEENAIFYVMTGAANAPLQHEMGHLYSWRSWGPPAGYWLSEGIAVYAAGDCAGEDLHAWAAKLALENRLTDFPELEQESNFSKTELQLQAGSFVKYIMDKYGVRSFRLLWESGFSASSAATGLEMDALLDNWTTHIMQNEFTAAAQFLDLDGKINCE